jgi:Flp pilus assembly protein TadD
MFHRSAVLVLFLLVFSLCSLPQINSAPFPRSSHEQSHETLNSIAGTVLSNGNKPLGNIFVELRSPTGSTVGSTYTTSAGSFEFSQIPSGSYDVLATSGIDQAQQRISLSGIPTNVVLRLPVSAPVRDGNDGASISVAQYKVPEKARAAVQKAEQALTKGKNDEAQKQVEKALEIDPRYADALTFRAVIKMSNYDMQGAKADLQQALAQDQNCSLAFFAMGSVLNAESKFDEAVRSLERGLSLAPNSWQGYFEMGKALLGKGQYQAAIRQFDRAGSLVPVKFPVLHLARAHALLGLQDYTDAVTELQAFLAKEHEGPRVQEAQKLMSYAQSALSQAGK